MELTFNRLFGENSLEVIRRDALLNTTLGELSGDSLDRTVIFAWKGKAKDYKVWWEEQMRHKEIQDEDNANYVYDLEREPRWSTWK
jgi:hypothetical protein